METWSHEHIDNLPKNGFMTFDKFTCTKTALGGHFQLTSQTLVFNGQFSFVLTMQNIIFPIFGRLIFCIWDHDKTTWRYGWIVSSPRNMPMLPNEFYHQNNPSFPLHVGISKCLFNFLNLTLNQFSCVLKMQNNIFLTFGRFISLSLNTPKDKWDRG